MNTVNWFREVNGLCEMIRGIVGFVGLGVDMIKTRHVKFSRIN